MSPTVSVASFSPGYDARVVIDGHDIAGPNEFFNESRIDVVPDLSQGNDGQTGLGAK